MISEELLENLDGSFPNDLLRYARRLAKMPLSGEDGHTRDLLVLYARRKASAMKHRSAGNIPTALRLEGICETIYRRLPEYARW